MFRIIFPNRWFIWTIVLIFVIAVLTEWVVMLFAIEQSIAVSESNIRFLEYRIKKEQAHKDALDTSDWKTYRNEKYGFEFQYPQGLNFEIVSAPDDGQKAISESEFLLTGQDLSRLIIAPLGLSFPDLNQVNVKKTDVVIGGLSGKRFELRNSSGIRWVVVSEIANVGFPRFEFLITAINARFSEGDLRKDEIASFETIISTLKFFEPSGQ